MNLDVELAKIIAEKLRRFHKASFGTRVFLAEESAAEAEMIISIAERLELYARRWDHTLEDELVIESAGQSAFRDLAEILPRLWI